MPVRAFTHKRSYYVRTHCISTYDIDIIEVLQRAPNKWSPPLGRLGQPEAGTSVGTHITPSRITQSCTAWHVYNRRAHNVPVECPRGPLSMCVTTGTYVVRTVRTFVSLSLHDLRSIVKLRLIDTSTTTYHFTRRDDTPVYVAIIRLTHTTHVLRNFLLTQNTLACDSQKLRLSD